MPELRRTVVLGEIRDASTGEARAIEGLAVPYDTPYRLPWGEVETIRPHAFAGSVAQWRERRDARPAYLDRHGGSAVAAITTLRDSREGVRFRAELIRGDDGALIPAAAAYLAQVRAGINGASIEYLPDEVGGTQLTRDGYAVLRGSILAIAGAHAPAYDAARVVARSEGTMPAPITTPDAGAPVDFAARLSTMRTDALAEARSYQSAATAEGRELTPDEDRAVSSATERAERIGRQADAYGQERARLATERAAASSAAQGSGSTGARVTRAEAVYRGERGVSWFRDVVASATGDHAAAERLGRHRALVSDLADRLERRAIESSELAGAIPTQYAPELYVPDVAYTGPFMGFFPTTPITNAAPIVVPRFATVTGDTGPQGTENTALPNVDITTAPLTITPAAVGGESIVARQVVDGASPGADIIIGAYLRELLMRDQERAIGAVLHALTAAGTLPDTAGTGAAQSGRDLERGLRLAIARMMTTRFLPAEGVFANSTDYEQLVQGEDTTGRPIMPVLGPTNASGTFGPGFAGGVIAGVPVANAWALTDPLDNIVARRNDGRAWASTLLDIRLVEREGPQSIVFAVWQYLAFAVLQPKGVARWTYTNVLAADAQGRKSAKAD